jgi:hypothetical protein
MDTVQIAEQVESKLHDLLGETPKYDPYSLEGARLYGVHFGDKGEVVIDFITSHADVYDLLADTKNAVVASGFAYTLVVTTGWAAPLNANGEVEGAPSQHALRRRVRLAVVANRQSVASVLRFQDEPNEPITDPGEATGSLADAIKKFVSQGASER